MDIRTVLRLGIGVTLLLAGCSKSSPTALPSLPSSVPVVTPNPSNTAFGTLCTDLGQLEQVVAGIIGGTIAPSDGIQQVQHVAQALAGDGQALQQTQPQLAAIIDDLSTAVDELRAALSRGGDVLGAVRDNAVRISADLAQVPANVCGSAPSPLPT